MSNDRQSSGAVSREFLDCGVKRDWVKHGFGSPLVSFHSAIRLHRSTFKPYVREKAGMCRISIEIVKNTADYVCTRHFGERTVQLYHGTTLEAAKSMLKDGIDLFHARKADPGDFGRGFYLTGNLHRAKACGTAILEASLDVSEYAYIPNPYEPDNSPAGQLFRSLAFRGDSMLTCENGVPQQERHRVCSLIRDTFLKHGWKGIRADYNGGEYVVFDLSTIRNLEIQK